MTRRTAGAPASRPRPRPSARPSGALAPAGAAARQLRRTLLADGAGQAFAQVLHRRERELLRAGVRLDAVAAAFGPVAVAVEGDAGDVARAARPLGELEDRPGLFEFAVLQRVAGRAFRRE